MKATSVFLITVAMFTVIHVESKRMQNVDEIRKAVKGLRKTCANKIGAPKEILDGATQGDFPPDPKLQCYLKCVMTTTKVMRNDVMQIDFLRTQAEILLPEEFVEPFKDMVEACKDVHDDDGCLLAWKFAQCYYNFNPSIYFLP